MYSRTTVSGERTIPGYRLAHYRARAENRYSRKDKVREEFSPLGDRLHEFGSLESAPIL